MIKMKLGKYTEDEIFEYMTGGNGVRFLGRSMYDAIFDKIHALITENEQLQNNWNELKKWLESKGTSTKEENDALCYFYTYKKMQELQGDDKN